MGFSEKAASLWQNIILFCEALEHDPRSDMAQEIDRLIAARNSDRAELAAISSRVEALAAEVHDRSVRVNADS